MRTLKNAVGIALNCKVLFDTWAVNPDGSEVALSSSHNLLLDGGMDDAGANVFARLFAYCAVGTGITPTSRPSGSITVSRTASTLTASAGFFEAADVGRIFKFNTGERVRISGFTNAQNVDTVDAGTIAAAQGTIWYVNEIGHQTEVMRTANYATTSGNCISSFLVDTWTHQRFFLFDAAPSGGHYLKEIGWSTGGGSTRLSGRALIPGGGDSLGEGQRYKVRVRMIVKYSAATVSNTLTAGTFSTAGDSQIELCLPGRMNSDGSNDNGLNLDGFGNLRGAHVLEPGVPLLFWGLSSSALPLQSISGTPEDITVLPRDKWDGLAGYSSFVSGVWTRTLSTGIDVTDNDISNINSLFLHEGGGRPIFRTLFTAPQTKQADYRVNFQWVISWDRDMPN